MASQRHQTEADATCEISGKDGLKGLTGLNIHKQRNKTCKRLSLIHGQQQYSQSQQQSRSVLTVDIRFLEAQVWLRPQARLASDIETIHLGDHGPDVQRLFQEILDAQQQENLSDRMTLNAANSRRRFLLWESGLPFIRYCVSVYLLLGRLAGNTLDGFRHLVSQLGSLLYQLVCLVYYCIALILPVAVIYTVSHTLTSL